MTAAADIGMVENASTTLYEARVLVTATEAFVRETRGWLNLLPNSHSAIHCLTDLDTMLSMLGSHIDKAKSEIDDHVEAVCAERRATLSMVGEA